MLARLPARAALAAGGLAGLGLLIGVALSLAPSGRRPDLKGAARFVDARAGARDPYAEVPLIFSPAPELAQGLRLGCPMPIRPPARSRSATAARCSSGARGWRRRGGSGCSSSGRKGRACSGCPSRPPIWRPGVRREQTRRFDGIFPIDVEVWGPR